MRGISALEYAESGQQKEMRGISAPEYAESGQGDGMSSISAIISPGAAREVV